MPLLAKINQKTAKTETKEAFIGKIGQILLFGEIVWIPQKYWSLMAPILIF